MGQHLSLETGVARALLEQQPDAMLARAAAQGHAEAFTILCQRHRTRVVAVCRRVLKDEGEAEEAAQDALLSAFQHLKAFEGRAAFSTWLHTIALNCAKMRLRKKRPQARSDLLAYEPSQTVLSSAPPPRPDHAALAREHGLAAARAFETLDPESQQALVGRLWERPLSDIARETGITVGGVKTRIFRARAALRRQLGAAGLGTTLDAGFGFR